MERLKFLINRLIACFTSFQRFFQLMSFFKYPLLLIVFAILSGKAFALTSGAYHYELVEDGTAVEITDFEGDGVSSATIPSEIDGKPVTKIGDSAFESAVSLTEIVVPQSVVSIGSFAFSGCYSLASIDLPEGLATIGAGAFQNCISLKSISIPASVTEIGEIAFSLCSTLSGIEVSSTNERFRSLDGVVFSKDSTVLHFFPAGKVGSYVIPGSVTAIDAYAFSFCFGLASLSIPDSVAYIGEGAFSHCGQLQELVIPSTTTDISAGFVTGCTNLQRIEVETGSASYREVDGVLFSADLTLLHSYPGGSATAYAIPYSVISIGDHAFAVCLNLRDIAIPESVTRIGKYAFQYCAGLTQVTVPESVIDISESAFLGCSNLGGVSLPDTLVSIGDSVFSGCSNLIELAIPSSVTRIGEAVFSECTALESVTLPSGISKIEAATFSGCFALASIEIPDSVTSIGDGAFYYCGGLQELEIPQSVTTIGDAAFEYCFRLASVSIPASVIEIGSRAFRFCSQLSMVVIPESVVRIGDAAFYGCDVLSSAYFDGDAPSDFGSEVFEYDAKDFTIYYSYLATGYSSPIWSGYPAQPFDVDDPGFEHWRVMNQVTLDEDEALLAYAFSLDPNLSLLGALPRPELDEGRLSIRFYAGRSDIMYRIQTSPDLAIWTDVSGVQLDEAGYCSISIETLQSPLFLKLELER